jgi:aminomethyltransferase
VAAGARPIGLDAVELLRIEAGLVIQDEDYFPGETDPYDLSLERFIDLEGHLFVGRDVCLARAPAPPRRFVTLVLDGDDPPEPGTRVTRSRADVGVVRSSRVTPRFGCLALSVVDVAASSDGERVVVNGRPATVRSLPIDDPGKRRRARILVVRRRSTDERLPR